MLYSQTAVGMKHLRRCGLFEYAVVSWHSPEYITWICISPLEFHSKISFQGRTENFNWSNAFTCSCVSWLTLYFVFPKRSRQSLWLVFPLSSGHVFLSTMFRLLWPQSLGSVHKQHSGLIYFSFFCRGWTLSAGSSGGCVDVHCWRMCKEASLTPTALFVMCTMLCFDVQKCVSSQIENDSAAPSTTF